MYKNTVKGIMVSGLVLGGMIAGATVTQPTQANASSRPSYSAKRNNSVKLVWRKSMKRHAFHTTKGALYSKHLGYKYANMSAYPKTTWYTIGHEKLHNKVKGTNPIYYQVVSANGKQTGWVYRGYLKKGAYTVKAKGTKSSDDYYAKLANQMTKDASKKASDANKGSKTNTNTNTNGGTKTNTNTNSGSKTPTKTPSVPKMSEAQYNSEVASAFLSQLNVERTKRGLAPAVMTAGSMTQQVADGRVPQILSQQVKGQAIVLDHDYNGHDAALMLMKQLHLGSISTDETLSGTGRNDGSMVMNEFTPEQVAQRSIQRLIYNDAQDGNGHRDTLLSKNETHIGIGVGQKFGSVLLVTEGDVK